MASERILIPYTVPPAPKRWWNSSQPPLPKIVIFEQNEGTFGQTFISLFKTPRLAFRKALMIHDDTTSQLNRIIVGQVEFWHFDRLNAMFFGQEPPSILQTPLRVCNIWIAKFLDVSLLCLYILFYSFILDKAAAVGRNFLQYGRTMQSTAGFKAASADKRVPATRSTPASHTVIHHEPAVLRFYCMHWENCWAGSPSVQYFAAVVIRWKHKNALVQELSELAKNGSKSTLCLRVVVASVHQGMRVSACNLQQFTGSLRLFLRFSLLGFVLTCTLCTCAFNAWYAKANLHMHVRVMCACTRLV